MVTLTASGIIKGGVCDRLHRSRSGRVKGAWRLIQEAHRRGCIATDHVNRAVRVRGCPWKGYRWRDIAHMGGADIQIGIFRAMDVLRACKWKYGGWVPWDKFVVFIEGTMACEFGVIGGVGLDEGDAFKHIAQVQKGDFSAFGLAPAHHPGTYRERLKNGELKEPQRWDPWTR